MIWLSFLCGFFLGCALASLVYQRKFRHLARAYRDLKADIDAMRAAMFQGTDAGGGGLQQTPTDLTSTKH